MDEESRQINKRLDDMIKEYNDLAEKYNKLIQDKKELERKNKEKALAVLYPERTR